MAARGGRPAHRVHVHVGRPLGPRPDGNGGLEGRITGSYRFTRPGQGITLFSRTMTIETDKDTPLPDRFFQFANPAKIDAYHAAVARELREPPD